jgi:hypothetical protein
MPQLLPVFPGVQPLSRIRALAEKPATPTIVNFGTSHIDTFNCDLGMLVGSTLGAAAFVAMLFAVFLAHRRMQSVQCEL